jgi:hypothetical protein
MNRSETSQGRISPPSAGVKRCWKLLGLCVAGLLAASVLTPAALHTREIDPRLEALRPLLVKTWQGTLKSPDGKSESLVVKKFDLLEKGRVIKLTETNRDLDSFGEGFIYWDDASRSIRLFFVQDSGVVLDGTVDVERNVITFHGTMSWPARSPNLDVKQSYDFRNTLELLSDTSMRDSWFQNAFGPWRPGHVIDFEAKAVKDDHLCNSTPLDVSFRQASAAGTEREKTLQSVLKVRDISERYATGGLYLITHYGDREALFEKENDELLRNNWINQPWRFCTIFSTKSADSVVIGRNWDNQNVGSVIVSRYKPSEGYASVSFSRAIDLGFPLNVRIDEMAATPFGDKLLLAPFYAYDGINDQGLFASVTGVSQVQVNSKEEKRKVFIGYLVRKILDRCRTVEEALKLVEDYVPFDLDDSSLNCHFFVADASGRSVILEYVQDTWKKTFPGRNWQVLTNKVASDTLDSVLREKCWRYKTASEELEESGGRLDWAGGMRILKDVSQSGTTWSVVYLPRSAEILFSVYQDWDRIYRLRFPER